MEQIAFMASVHFEEKGNSDGDWREMSLASHTGLCVFHVFEAALYVCILLTIT